MKYKKRLTMTRPYMHKGPGDFSPPDPPERICDALKCICLTPDGKCELGWDVNNPWYCIDKYEDNARAMWGKPE